MDQDVTKRLDAVLEDEIRRGFRIKPVPQHIQELLKANALPGLTRVRFSRLNPARRRKIAETVQRQYHKDLRDDSILSHEQIFKLVEQRGEWSVEKQQRMEQLQLKTGRMMRELFAQGIGDSNWHADLLDAAAVYRAELIAAREAGALDQETLDGIVAVFERWIEYDPSRQALWTERYADAQGRPNYSVDADLNTLLDRSPSGEASDAINTIEELRHKLQDLYVLRREKLELDVLAETHAKIFSDSVESRRDTTEEMARIYYCTEQVSDADVPTGAVAKTFEALWDLPEDVVQWLLVEHYFFANGVADEAREYLSTFGFMRAERETAEETSGDGASAPSVESPVPPSSNPATTSATATASASSGSPVPTTSTTPS